MLPVPEPTLERPFSVEYWEICIGCIASFLLGWKRMGAGACVRIWAVRDGEGGIWHFVWRLL